MARDWLWIDPRCTISGSVVIHIDDCNCLRRVVPPMPGDDDD